MYLSFREKFSFRKYYGDKQCILMIGRSKRFNDEIRYNFVLSFVLIKKLYFFKGIFDI